MKCVCVCVYSFQEKRDFYGTNPSLFYQEVPSSHKITNITLVHPQDLQENKVLNSVGVWDTNTLDKDLLQVDFYLVYKQDK